MLSFPRLKSGRQARHLLSAKRGVAALEFALVAPVMGLMLVGVFDTSKAVILWGEVQNTAHLVAVSASTMSHVNSDRTTNIGPAVAQQAMSIVYAEMPWVRSGIEQGQRSVTLTSIEFAPKPGCTVTSTNNCYTANVAFSVAYYGGQATGPHPFQQITRSCGVLTQIGPKDPLPVGTSQLSVLRTGWVANPDALMMADVHYQYTPMFFKFITGPIDFWATNIFPARIGADNQNQSKQYTGYTGTDGTGPCLPAQT